jgi:heme oxygenase (biliverdin-IX-beta and delta-forming)
MINVKEQDYAYRLKQETKTAHQETEKVLVQRLQQISSKEDYVAILKMFYGYFEPLERLIHDHLNKTHLPDINERRKAARVQDDLTALKINGKPDICQTLPAIQNNSHAFGALYVIEGSTLGGEIIVKMLQRNTAVDLQDDALSFFYGYKEHNKTMWQKFQLALQEHVGNHNLEQVIAAADETFRLLKNWMLFQHETTSPY